MQKLILVKHARPHVVTHIPSDQWKLGDEGRLACVPLAQSLRTLAPTSIYCSVEPKARQTAELVAQALGIGLKTVGNLHEQDRSNVPHMDNRDFISAVAQLFAEPGQIVLGRESADQAYARFASAVDKILQETPDDVAVVSHGTVIALFAQRRSARDPFTLWRQMGQPSFLVFELPDWKIIQEEMRIAGARP